jgi:hypothetical protein
MKREKELAPAFGCLAREPAIAVGADFGLL